MREMKDSGNVWYGNIPYAWELNKIKYLTTIRSESAIYNPEEDKYIGLENVNGYSDNVVETDTEYDYSMQSICKKNDILFSKLRPYLAKVFIAKHNSFCTGEFIVFSSFNGDRRYLFYSILNPKFIENINSSTYGAKMPRANPQYIFDQQICLPPLDEQQRIAEFLDRECGKIDGLKADIQAQIDTLEQYKRSVITEAVTHGLNPSAPMKDSGIPWVDEVPQNWGIRRVKYIATCLKKGNGITKEDIVEDGDTLCIRYGEIYTKYNLSFFECTTRTNKERISSKQYFTQGDILFAGTGELIEEIGKNIVYLGTGDCLAGGDIIILKHKQNARYLNYALNSECVQAQKSCNKAKLKVVHISAFEIGNIKIALPPLDEQQEIADYLDNKCAAIEQIIADKKLQIETLDGYKKSLIYEYVTGKKEAV